jgi:hypothetical protein
MRGQIFWQEKPKASDQQTPLAGLKRKMEAGTAATRIIRSGSSPSLHSTLSLMSDGPVIVECLLQAMLQQTQTAATSSEATGSKSLKDPAEVMEIDGSSPSGDGGNEEPGEGQPKNEKEEEEVDKNEDDSIPFTPSQLEVGNGFHLIAYSMKEFMLVSCYSVTVA